MKKNGKKIFKKKLIENNIVKKEISFQTFKYEK